MSVKYTSGGDNTPTILATAIQGGKPPDLASIGQPGLLRDFANQGALKPIAFARATAARNYTADWLKLGTVKGKLYGLFFKGANKSTVWYSTAAFKAAGVKASATWPALLAAANTLRASGTPGVLDRRSVRLDAHRPVREHLPPPGGAGQVRPADRAHDPVDASVGEGRPADDGAGVRLEQHVRRDLGRATDGLRHVRQQRLGKPPKAAMVLEGDFVPGVATTPAKAIRDYNVFKFPSIGGSAPAVVGGGDIVVMFKDSAGQPGARQVPGDPAAATIAAKYAPGYSSPNKNVPPSAYSDVLNRATAIQLAHARTFRFDLSDLAPSAFGARSGRACSSCSRTSSRAPRT